MMIGESLFIKTGVETFNRNTLFGGNTIMAAFIMGFCICSN